MPLVRSRTASTRTYAAVAVVPALVRRAADQGWTSTELSAFELQQKTAYLGVECFC